MFRPLRLKWNETYNYGLKTHYLLKLVDVIPLMEADSKKRAQNVVEKAKEVYNNTWGDARNVICDAVDRHHISILVVGSHNYGAVKRALLGSVSDHCSHNAHCSVLIVKQPKY
ncbi:LlDD2A18 family protein [Salix suchowensis]|nr:LlDD2A18 family protein [Salix suchowensis]